MSLCNVPWSFLCFICICSAYALLDDKVKFFAARRLRSGTRSITCAKCSETPFLSSLLQVTPKLRHRFFFPGHSGVAPVAMNKLGSIQGLYRNDVPELEGTDNIHNPEGPLLHAQQLASKLYNARRTWFLVNGCSSGIMVAMLSCVRLHQMRSIPFEEKVHNSDARSIFIVGRDAHKSVFDALYLAQDCDAVLLPCPQDSTFHVSLGVTLESIKEAINVHGSKVFFAVC